MAEHERWLRRLALHDESFIESVLTTDLDTLEASGLDAKTRALIRLAALLAAGAEPASCHSAVAMALNAGATAEEVVGVLMAVAPVIGIVRTVATASHVAAALGYDIDAALERLDGDPP